MTSRDAVVRLSGTTRAALAASWRHGVSLASGDVAGSSAGVTWAPGEGLVPASLVPHPLRPGWDRDVGAPASVDIITDGAPVRVFTGMVESGSGDFADASSSSSLTDLIGRLHSPAVVPPIAYTMPRRGDITEDTTLPRRVGLWGTWITQMVMAQAGFQTSQSVQSSSVWHQSMAGSAWTTSRQVGPRPDHSVDTIGHLTTVHRVGDPDLAPQVIQGTNVPCMQGVYFLGSTLPRRASSSTAWQLIVDMATDAPTAAHTGRIDLRTLPQSAGAGVRLDWTQTSMRVYRRNTDGTLVLLGSAPRAAAGTYSMRWCLTVRPGGSLTLDANDRLGLVQVASHGVGLPSTTARATVVGEVEGPVGAVQVTRSDTTSIVTQATSARIYRDTFSNRSLPLFDFRDRRSAYSILKEQADAERGLLGMPLWMWIDHNGHLINADAAWLANRPTMHLLTNLSTNPIEDVGWSRPQAGPYSDVEVWGRFGVAHVNTPAARQLLYEGRQTNHGNGDALDQVMTPQPDTTWLQVDYWPYYAGQPLPPPGNQDFNNGIGSHVGGTRVTAADGDTAGWITPSMVDGWSLDGSDHVVGALDVIDHHTIVYKGTVNVGSAYAMSSMPSQSSSGLWAHRALQPLPQLRGWRGEWTDRVERVEVTGSRAHEILVHDTKDWCSSGTWRRWQADQLAQAASNPVTQVTLTVALNPTVRVGERVTARIDYPDGARLTLSGLVASVEGRAPGASMTVRLVVLSYTWVEAPDHGGGSSGGDFEVPPPARPPVPPPGTDPPEFVV